LTGKKDNKIAHFLTTKVKFPADCEGVLAEYLKERADEMVF